MIGLNNTVAAALLLASDPFEAYIKRFSITLPPSSFFDSMARSEILLSNLNMIQEHNMGYPDRYSYHVDVNKFAHLSEDEFLAMYKTFSPSSSLDPIPTPTPEPDTVVGLSYDPIDWEEKGAVTPVKDEAACFGGCWAFAATGAIEGARFIKTNELQPLSNQQLINCVYQTRDSCASGGDMGNAYDWVSRNGLCSEQVNEEQATWRRQCCVETT